METVVETKARSTGSRQGKNPWRILVVDDDQDVHSVTRLALNKLKFKERPIQFVSALNAEEARGILEGDSGIAVVLLDVVMEERNSGLQLADYIRKSLDNKKVRILLRTGQPGEAPEESVIINYDINNYLMKTELTRQKLVTNIISALRNYNELLEIEKRRLELAEREAANEARHAFLANMSHELGTPLNAILGFTRLMARDHEISSEQQEHLNIITQSARNLLSLINRVMEMSKIEAGFVKLEEHPADLLRHLEGVHSIFKARAEERRVELVLEVAEDTPRYVVLDEQKLHQVLVNLLSNALKFAEDGKVTLRVGPAERSSEDRIGVLFEVVDTGPGIPEEDQERIFEPFVQGVLQPRGGGGTGLGLAITRQFVGIMGGTLELESKSGQGAAFRFSLFLQPSSAKEVPAYEQPRTVVGLEKGQQAIRILVVDDAYENRLLLSQLLMTVGLDVRTASGALQGIEIWRQWQPTLVLLDARMPVMSGAEVVQTIRKEEAENGSPRAKIISLVPVSFKDEVERMQEAGGDDFLYKPVHEEMLFEKLKSSLEIKFIYSEEAVEEKKPAGNESLNLERLPRDWRARLYDAARAADDTLISRLLEEIKADFPEEAEFTRKLMDNFDYRRIMNLSTP